MVRVYAVKALDNDSEAVSATHTEHAEGIHALLPNGECRSFLLSAPQGYDQKGVDITAIWHYDICK